MTSSDVCKGEKIMLDKIIATKLDEIENIELPEQVDVPHYSLYEHLSSPNRKLALISEVKKASPSKGVIREDFDPVAIAKEYEAAGADAISCLTDVKYFQGSSEYLTSIKRHVSIPVLRKDFIINEIQIDESVRIGADAILLIAAVFEGKRLQELYDYAQEKGLECLVEVHSLKELEETLKYFTPKIIGVNNRDLTTFQTTLSQTELLSAHIPEGSLFISESGIHTSSDVDRVYVAGAKGILVGESLMRAKTPTDGIKQIFGESANETTA